MNDEQTITQQRRGFLKQAVATGVSGAFAGSALAAAASTAAAPVASTVALPKVSRYIELNHVIKNGLVTYQGIGLPPVQISDWAPRFSNDALLDQISMVNINGTYLDAPYHNDPHGEKISDWPLEKLVNLPALVVTKPAHRLTFELEDFSGLQVDGKAVLLFSGHSDYFGTARYGKDVPYLALSAAQWLLDQGVVLVGIDSQLIDNNAAEGAHNPVHKLLLGNKRVICEDLTNLAAMPSSGAYLTAIPPRVEMASFPARVFATVYE